MKSKILLITKLDLHDLNVAFDDDPIYGIGNDNYAIFD